MIASSVVVTATARAVMMRPAAGSCSTLQRGSCSPPADTASATWRMQPVGSWWSGRRGQQERRRRLLRGDATVAKTPSFACARR
jgi:hypothetical protein